jgi:uncharacterized protein YkwD
MRPLLVCGALVGTTLLVAIGRAAPAPRAMPAHQISTQRLATLNPESDPLTAAIPQRLIPRAETPSAPPQPIALPVPWATVRSKPAPVLPPVAALAPANVAVGTGQWGLINQDRQAAGLAPLQWSPCLANVAIGQAARMAAQGYISHANGRSLDLGCHLGPRASESIGVQGGGINDAAMNAWFMGDPPHRANILGPYHCVGVAWVLAPNHTAYLAVEFG